MNIAVNKIHTAVKAVIKKDNKFLVIKKVFGDDVIWDIPGGRMKYGESPQDALLREVKEETGLDVEIIGVLGVWWFFRRHGDNSQVVCLTFNCHSKNKDVDINNNSADEDIVEFNWVTKEEFLSDQYPVDHDSIKKLISDRL